MSDTKELHQNIAKKLLEIKNKDTDLLSLEELNQALLQISDDIKKSEEDEKYHNIFKEIAEILLLIHKSKNNLLATNHKKVIAECIPMAITDLDQIVKSTENAANNILDAAEEISNLTEKMPLEIREEVTKQIAQIFESCHFQDLTGQRINKIVGYVNEIEARIVMLLMYFSHQDHDAIEEDIDKSQMTLLQGPQKDASNQQDIDNIFDNA